MTVSDDFKECKKTKPAFVRLVRGSKEQVDTREGITWAFAETDYVMCGPNKDDNSPNENDVYPIKKTTFHETYEIVEEAEA
ncbi:MAG: hypothetical protein E3J82_06080 [Candidatus Thorarchaeota archaeon]|nr:MAG: hypothetical protein E3J82_06080 [Candidatus Thorarchaeota archaeon]